MSMAFDQQLERAGNLHMRGDVVAASTIYQELLKQQPDNPFLIFSNALADFDLGQRDGAISTLQELASSMPEVGKIRMELAKMLEREHRYADALDLFKLLSSDPEFAAEASIMAGHMHAQLDEVDASIPAYRAGIEKVPSNYEARVALTRALMLNGEWEQADRECNLILDARPGHTGASALKSILCYELGDADEARRIMNFDEQLVTWQVGDDHDAGALNAGLIDAITNHPTIKYEPKDYSTRKGYHTGDITDDTDGPIAILLQWFRKNIDLTIKQSRKSKKSAFDRRAPKYYRLNAWGVVMEDQGHQASHIHRDAWLSGVYYVKVPDSVHADDHDHAGWIEFGTPHDFPKRKTVSDTQLVMPSAGKSIFFPSFFYHRTIPLKSSETRISIAFDVLPT